MLKKDFVTVNIGCFNTTVWSIIAVDSSSLVNHIFCIIFTYDWSHYITKTRKGSNNDELMQHL